jgi:hypothetical protein
MKNNRAHSTPILAGALFVSAAIPSWHRVPQDQAILQEAVGRESQSLDQRQTLAESYSTEPRFVTGQDLGDALSALQATRGKLQLAEAPLTADFSSREFAVVPLAKSHRFAFGAV